MAEALRPRRKRVHAAAVGPWRMAAKTCETRRRAAARACENDVVLGLRLSGSAMSSSSSSSLEVEGGVEEAVEEEAALVEAVDAAEARREGGVVVGEDGGDGAAGRPPRRASRSAGWRDGQLDGGGLATVAAERLASPQGASADTVFFRNLSA